MITGTLIDRLKAVCQLFIEDPLISEIDQLLNKDGEISFSELREEIL